MLLAAGAMILDDLFPTHLPPGTQIGVLPFGVGAAKCPGKGSYTHTFESGKQYMGKGTPRRMKVSGKELEGKTGDKLSSSNFDPSNPNTDRQALIDEAEKIQNAGGLPNPNLYNQINSPGNKWLQQQNQ